MTTQKSGYTDHEGNKYHPDWEHTPDGDYQPKSVKYTIDGDMIYKGSRQTQEDFNYRREREIW